MGSKEIIAGAAGGDRLHRLLYEHDGMALRNIKFFRGHRDVVSTAELESAIHSAILAKRTGRASGFADFPDVARAPVDVRELVKNL